MKLAIGISGASGAHLGVKFLKALPKEIEKYCVISNGAKAVLKNEGFLESLANLNGVENLELLDDDNLGANIASGSFGIDALAVIPCSQNTLAKIACGICDTLLTRCASVMLKERKTLLLGVREMPLSSIVLENMLKLSNFGAIISPPMLGYYAGGSLEDVEKYIIGKWCDSLGINSDYKRWGKY